MAWSRRWSDAELCGSQHSEKLLGEDYVQLYPLEDAVFGVRPLVGWYWFISRFSPPPYHMS